MRSRGHTAGRAARLTHRDSAGFSIAYTTGKRKCFTKISRCDATNVGALTPAPAEAGRTIANVARLAALF